MNIVIQISTFTCQSIYILKLTCIRFSVLLSNYILFCFPINVSQFLPSTYPINVSQILKSSVRTEALVTFIKLFYVLKS
jgi:hypothetical protein